MTNTSTLPLRTDADWDRSAAQALRQSHDEVIGKILRLTNGHVFQEPTLASVGDSVAPVLAHRVGIAFQPQAG